MDHLIGGGAQQSHNFVGPHHSDHFSMGSHMGITNAQSDIHLRTAGLENAHTQGALASKAVIIDNLYKRSSTEIASILLSTVDHQPKALHQPQLHLKSSPQNLPYIENNTHLGFSTTQSTLNIENTNESILSNAPVATVYSSVEAGAPEHVIVTGSPNPINNGSINPASVPIDQTGGLGATAIALDWLVKNRQEIAKEIFGTSDLTDEQMKTALDIINQNKYSGQPNAATSTLDDVVRGLELRKEALPIVDNVFLKAREGYSSNGYVPKDAAGKPSSNSGVTIGVGLDLGNKTVTSLQKMGISDSIISALSPYLGLKGQDAQSALDSAPLSLSSTDADAASIAAEKSFAQAVQGAYNSATGGNFNELPIETKTAIDDINYQYGDLAKATPNFWSEITSGNWSQAVSELRNFDDAYPTRRNAEADLIQQDINLGLLK
ncbi:pesticin C-terminus-like muramidase [Gluconobacter cerinus]|uniref:Pesticin C-terminal domain-containing protein n=1 Tax=Gluconobacter cerinus TaxID=38307 RepID=A0AAV5NK21_9PROT|nr:pesticin C-terminus-like muramidase [Gluconobacter cerinus]GLQ64365.1 hypothetical protein GCM10007867_32130 [Gluconobacter cerinus]